MREGVGHLLRWGTGMQDEKGGGYLRERQGDSKKRKY